MRTIDLLIIWDIDRKIISALIQIEKSLARDIDRIFRTSPRMRRTIETVDVCARLCNDLRDVNSCICGRVGTIAARSPYLIKRLCVRALTLCVNRPSRNHHASDLRVNKGTHFLSRIFLVAVQLRLCLQSICNLHDYNLLNIR